MLEDLLVEFRGVFVLESVSLLLFLSCDLFKNMLG
jgi:hypothetical protein